LAYGDRIFFVSSFLWSPSLSWSSSLDQGLRFTTQGLGKDTGPPGCILPLSLPFENRVQPTSSLFDLTKLTVGHRQEQLLPGPGEIEHGRLLRLVNPFDRRLPLATAIEGGAVNQEIASRFRVLRGQAGRQLEHGLEILNRMRREHAIPCHVRPAKKVVLL